MLSEYQLAETIEVYKSETGVVKIVLGDQVSTETVDDPTFEKVTAAALRGSLFDTESHYGWQFALSPDDVVYGLGESVRGMNKRGFVYEAFCADDPSHTPDKSALYGAHNFFVVVGEETYGVYVDAPGWVKFDVGFEESDRLKVYFEKPSFQIYLFSGDFREIVSSFRALIGLSYVPPKWGFGYQQSRWSYENSEVVSTLADTFKAHDIPIDAIYLDIDYMTRFKDFTIDDGAFPDFKAFVAEMASQGIKLVPIIDAGVKIEDGYSVYEEGIEGRHFVKDVEGNPFVAAVWPGRVHFPDFLNAETRRWFGAKYHLLLEMGIKGFWNDMNEPAIFYSETGLKEAFAYAREQEDKNLDIYTFFGLKDRFMHLSNAERDYKAMYHDVDGNCVNHWDVHNLYGYNMTRSAFEGFQSYDARQRVLMITRASHIGMAKYSGIWTGDNASWWEHLKLNIQMMPALNMAGFLYAGADTGGFGANCSGELLTRWMQFSLFTPLLRNHSAMGTRRQEPWQFGDTVLKTMRETIRLRYALIPYLYSEFMKANFDQTLMFAPLSYRFSGRRVLGVENQLLLGREVMLAPVYEQNAVGRYVHVPEKMAYVPLKSYEALGEMQWRLYEPGDYHIDVPMDETPLFLRKNKLVPLVAPASHVEALENDRYDVIGYVEEYATYTLYDDDGETFDYLDGMRTETTFEVKRTDEGYSVSVETDNLKLKQIRFYILDEKGIGHTIEFNTQGTPINYV